MGVSRRNQRARLRPVSRVLRCLVVSYVVGVAYGQLPEEPKSASEIVEVVARTVAVRPERPEVLSASRPVVDVGLLIGAKPGDVIALNVAMDVRYLGTVERVERRAAERYTVSGQLQGAEHGTFLLIVEDDSVVGIVRDPTASLLYRIGQQREGISLIEEVDSRQFPPESVPVLALEIFLQETNDRDKGVSALVDESDFVPVYHESACANTATIFDVMVVWTPKARQAMGGTNASQAEAMAAIDEANTAYRNSGINARMRLVHTAETAYGESGSSSEHLDRLINPVDGIMDDVHALRNTYRADFVNLFVDDVNTAGIGSCSAGVATAYSVARWDLAAANYTLAHEIGHNMGCGHNREDNDVFPCGAQPYAFGWRWFGNSGSGYRSVMAYPDGSTYTRVPYFSNPDVLFDGQPTGVPIGTVNQAHNTATVNLTPGFYEAFHITRFDVWVDFSASPLGNGTYQLPYNNVATGSNKTVHGSGASELPTLWIKAGSTSELLTIRNSMRVQACGGTARIGVEP